MMQKCYLDTETCGLSGMPVLLQYAYDDGPIHLYDIWKEPVAKTLKLIEEIMKCCVVGFNLSFDHFQLCKLYTIWLLLPGDFIPETDIGFVATMESLGRDGPCLKPASALDLMLHSRKGEFQSLMSRNDVRIRRVPTVLAPVLAQELEGRIEFDGILFAKRTDPNAPKWSVMDRVSPTGEIDPDFKDVRLRFDPAGGLKYLAEHALKIKPDYHYEDVELGKDLRPAELGYVPFANGISSPDVGWAVTKSDGKLKGYAWPALIQQHIDHWATNEPARKYAEDDVKYTRMLDAYFNYPDPDDDDSILACMVAAVRWHGFMVDFDQTDVLLEKAQAIVNNSPVNVNKVAAVREYILEVMDATETILIDQSTKKANLEHIRDEMVVIEPGEICVQCFGDGCKRCVGVGELAVGPMEAAKRAGEILAVREAVKEVNLYGKLKKAGRFHADFNVIGTLSSRMSGGGGLNAQGIKNSVEVRQMFPLAWDGMVLCGGDFDSFEVTLADAVFKDEALRGSLLAGEKIHALMGMELYPGKTYEEIIASKGFGDGGVIDMYTRGKQAIFALLYGGDENTIHNKLAVPLKVAEEAFSRFQKKFIGIKECRDANFEKFQALRQPDGIGTKVIWKDPDEFAETFLGFRRYFTLENKVCKALFKLAANVPKTWQAAKGMVTRSDREQTAAGAVSSALYGATFQLQAANTRAANNHLIQSPGAQITKRVQCAIWELQPSGVSEWMVAPMNIHDEVMCVTHPSVVEPLVEKVRGAVEHYRPMVPLIGMTWSTAMDNWAEKSGGGKGREVHIDPTTTDQIQEALAPDDATVDLPLDIDIDYLPSNELDLLETGV